MLLGTKENYTITTENYYILCSNNKVILNYKTFLRGDLCRS